MTRFLHSHELALTPLTPIHIGCGEDFEPTNYVIDESVLFHFDAAAVPLADSERSQLLRVVDGKGDESLRDVQNFFYGLRERCTAHSRLAVAVASGIADQYAKRVGRAAQIETGGRTVTNRLEIERTMFHVHSGAAYVPGSSIKGAMRTAWLDKLNRGAEGLAGEKPAAMEARLLGGGFHADPFRLIRIADATGTEVSTKVVFATNQKKRAVFKNNLELHERGPSARREVIVGGQYRALKFNLRIDNLGNVHHGDKAPASTHRIDGWSALAAACNRYYLPRLRADLKLLDQRQFADPRWLAAMAALVDRLSPILDGGKALLLRVGRHSGAENVTLDGVRSIRIMKGPSQRAAWEKQSTTVWLAAEHEDDRSNLLPFGWLLVELADNPDQPVLRDWCADQPKPDMTQVRARLAQARAQAAASEQGRLVMALSEKLQRASGRKQPVGGTLYNDVRTLTKQALENDWPAADKHALGLLVETTAFEKIDFGGKAKEFRAAAKALKGES